MKRDKIRMRLKSECKSKLAFVKIVKEYTGNGLKDSKFAADEMFDNQKQGSTNWTELEIFNNKMPNFTELKFELSEIGADCDIVGGVQWQRNYKMLELGIGDSEDYRLFIKEYIISTSDDHLELLISKLSDESLQEVFKEISKEIKESYDSNL